MLNKHRQGDDWQSLTATLIGQTWERLSFVNDDLLTRINERGAVWQDLVKLSVQAINAHEKCLLTGLPEPNAGCETVEKCPLLTGSKDDLLTDEMSVINPLSIVLISDIDGNQKKAPLPSRGTPSGTIKNHSKTDLNNTIASLALASSESASDDINRETSPRPTATVLRSDIHLLDEVERGRKRYGKGSKENDFERAAHNLRNDDSNPRNNLATRLRRIIDLHYGKPLPLFAPAEVIRLTSKQRAALDHWKGTRYEINL